VSDDRGACSRILWKALLSAAGIAALGDLYLVWGRVSSTAFHPFALLFPLAAVLQLLAMSVVAVRTMRPANRLTKLAGAAAGLLVVVVAVLNLVPPVARDELTHHLSIPALYLQAQRIVEVPFADHAYYPMLVEMFYTPMLRWLPDNTPKYLHLLYGVGSAAWLLLYLRRRHAPATAALAGLLLLVTPVTTVLAASAYVDLGLLFYASGAMVALLVWAEEERIGWLVVAGLLAGFSASTKYNGLVVILLLGAGTILLPSARQGSGRRLGYALLFGVLALLPLAPWLIKNAAETGNPVFPLFNGVIGGRPLPEAPGVDILTRRRVIYGESWLEIALIPIRIFTTGREGDPARFDGVFNPVLLLGMVAAVWTHASRPHRLLALYAVGYASLAFMLITLRVRYSIVIVAPLALLTALELTRLLAAGGLRARFAQVALAGALLFSAAHLALLWRHLQPLSYWSGGLDRDAYVSRFVPEYQALAFANRELPADARIYLLFLGNRSYYCKRSYVYDTYFSGAQLRAIVRAAPDGAAIASGLHRQGVTHLLAAEDLLVRFLGDSMDQQQLERWQEFSLQHLRPLYRDGGFGLYEVRGG
jgi:hypothetical protein